MACVGLGQLLYDRDAWLLRRFDPPVTLFSEGQNRCIKRTDFARMPLAAQ